MKSLNITFYFILYYFTPTSTFYIGKVYSNDYNGNNEMNKRATNVKKKINCVMFFADTMGEANYENSSGLTFLKMDKKPGLKHCTNYPRNILSRKKRHFKTNKRGCGCYSRLQEGILSLLDYAQNKLGMVTALGSLTNHSFSNSIRFANSEINLSHTFDKGEGNMNDSINNKMQNAHGNNPPTQSQGNTSNADENSIPRMSDQEEQNLRQIPLLNVFPKDAPPPFYSFTDEEERRKRSEGPYVMEPEHTEVFKIRTKRNIDIVSQPIEIKDPTYLNPEQKVKSFFDILDIMGGLQKSLFGSILQDESDMFIHDSDACPFQHNMYRSIRQPGLFEVVQKTLFNVINATDTGFLIIIIGGNLSDISSAYSPLVQSIKHIAENTEENSTLIVLTGTCPNSPDAPKQISCEQLNKKNLPLFAVGPGSEDFANCYELYDVPLTVKRILSRYNSEISEAQPETKQELPPVQRIRRNFDGDDEYYDKESEEIEDDEEEYHWIQKRARSSGSNRKGSTNISNNNLASYYFIITTCFYFSLYSFY